MLLLESSFQKFLFDRSQTKEPFYELTTISNLILTMTPDRINGGTNMIDEIPPLRPITFKLLSMLTSSLVFNKNSVPCSLLPKERLMLQAAFSNAATNLLYLINMT